MAHRILLIEDEKALSMIIRETLELYELQVAIAGDGMEGLQLFTELSPALVILDVMLPRMDGFAVLQQIRAQQASVPIIMLTSKIHTTDLVKGFELGCNDYVKKPFIMDELLVRVRSLLNKSVQPVNELETAHVTRIGNYIFHIHAQELRSPTQVWKLSFKETEILKRLLIYKNRVMERRAVLLELWGDDNLFNSRNLNVYITRLRNLFKEDPAIEILNIRGIGYKLVIRNR